MALLLLLCSLFVVATGNLSWYMQRTGRMTLPGNRITNPICYLDGVMIGKLTDDGFVKAATGRHRNIIFFEADGVKLSRNIYSNVTRYDMGIYVPFHSDTGKNFTCVYDQGRSYGRPNVYGHSYNHVAWYDSEVTFHCKKSGTFYYTMDPTDPKFEPIDENPRYNERIVYSTDKGSKSMTIYNLSTKDEGFYICGNNLPSNETRDLYLAEVYHLSVQSPKDKGNIYLSEEDPLLIKLVAPYGTTNVEIRGTKRRGVTPDSLITCYRDGNIMYAPHLDIKPNWMNVTMTSHRIVVRFPKVDAQSIGQLYCYWGPLGGIPKLDRFELNTYKSKDLFVTLY